MAQISAFLRSTNRGFIHYCPACGEAHHYQTNNGGDGGPQWSFNGDVDKPTFAPSMLIRWGNKVPGQKDWKDEDGKPEGGVCHYFLRAGMLEFCADSTHGLAGKSVPLPALPDHMQGNRYGDGNP